MRDRYFCCIPEEYIWNKQKKVSSGKSLSQQKGNGRLSWIILIILGIIQDLGCLLSLREVFLLKRVHIIPGKSLLFSVVWRSLSISTGLPGGSYSLQLSSSVRDYSTSKTKSVVLGKKCF